MSVWTSEVQATVSVTLANGDDADLVCRGRVEWSRDYGAELASWAETEIDGRWVRVSTLGLDGADVALIDEALEEAGLEEAEGGEPDFDSMLSERETWA